MARRPLTEATTANWPNSAVPTRRTVHPARKNVEAPVSRTLR
jgi:hypothetical protein